jgi:arginyl-tRNA synthetase
VQIWLPKYEAKLLTQKNRLDFQAVFLILQLDFSCPITMNIYTLLEDKTRQCLQALYQLQTDDSLLQLQKTKKEFEGDLTLVVFPFIKAAKKSPEATAEEIGSWLLQHTPELSSYNVIKGFLNLSFSASYWLNTLQDIAGDTDFEMFEAGESAPLVMIEYSSPNTNKPLHLGHIRNNLLGFSLSRIVAANGCRVVKTNIVNDRGIHICKSMLAWQKWGKGETPESSGKKGDHLVGDYYVLFDKNYKQELAELQKQGLSLEEAENTSHLMQEAREMLRAWEAGDSEIRSLWETMNNWVYLGFDESYAKLGVDFDKIYYESQTYLSGKEKVLEGLDKGIFYRNDDGSVWADLSSDGLDQKLLLRADGTSVYMTQDIGTAALRFEEYPIDKMIYVVGNEQNYHFKVLSILLDKLGFAWGKDLVHFSYGMVELPEGKMKSREGTVVDADDLIEEMISTARETSEELGKLDSCSSEEAADIARIVGLGALKYFILKVDPRKNMTFNPKESIDFNGNTGPFIQYTYARIRSVLRKAEELGYRAQVQEQLADRLSDKELSLIKNLYEFPVVVKEAGNSYSQAVIANYVYELAKEYNQFYHDYSVLYETNSDLRDFRILLSDQTAKVIRMALYLLGIEVPERM